MKILLASLLAVMLVSPAHARDRVQIVGSSTVFPFSSVVAEKFGRNTQFNSPVVESTGSGGGMKMFCKGVGTNTPDITNSSRAIKESERKLCASNNVTPIERHVGFDGITISQSKKGPNVEFTKEEIYKAVALKVWNGKEFVDNPYDNWSDINPDLPDIRIDVMIPPVTSGTRDAFVELVMHDVCKKQYGLPKKGDDGYKKQCSAVRTTNHVVQMGENDNLLVEKLQKDERRFGVFGFSFFDMNRDVINAVAVDGVKPEFETIADGSYGISRPLYYYIKKEHIGFIPGVMEYDAYFKQLSAPDGPLADLGLIAID